MRFFSTRQKGFTLVEIVLVAAIIAIVAAVVVANIQGARKKSRDTQRVSDMQQIQLALRLYKDANGAYPDCASGMKIATGESAPAGCAVNVVTAITPFLAKLPVDPLGSNNTNAYVYDSAIECATDSTSHAIIYARQTETGSAAENWDSVCRTRACGAASCGTQTQKDTLPLTNGIRPQTTSHAIILK